MARLLGYADALGVKHIVFGHQPGNYTFNDGSKRKKGTMFENFGGLVFLIDMGMSRGVDYSQGALLRIETKRRRPCSPTDRRNRCGPSVVSRQ